MSGPVVRAVGAVTDPVSDSGAKTTRWDATADLVVLGSGVAGLTAASRGRELGLRVLVVTKGAISDGSTRWAQGGVAVVLDEETDSVAGHAADTVNAGAGLCDEAAVRDVVAAG
uniref:FAD-binding protein n=1 Tax=Saccharomonospora saliphila TaxID=369829 RepID=UPI00066269FF